MNAHEPAVPHAPREVRYQRSPDVAYTDLTAHEGVLLNLANQRYYSLNETGVAIWHALERPCRPEEIAAQLTRQFAVEEAEALAFVHPFLRRLHADGLAEIADS